LNFKSINRRIIVVNLILPLNLLISLILMFSQIVLLERSITEDNLNSKKFLHKPLLNILENGEADKPIPSWLLLVAMDDGKIVYFTEDIEIHRVIWQDELKDIQLDQIKSNKIIANTMLANIVKRIPDTITMVPFSYNENNGLAVYMKDLLPLYMKVLQKPMYIGFVFFMTMVLFSLGLLQMNSHYGSVRDLIRASSRIKNKDLDTEIIPRKQTEMAEVFKAFDDMRKTLKSNREKETRFVMSVTHDLKTPLAAMRMYLEAMNDGYIEIQGEAEEAVKKILIKAGILEDRIGELLDYSKLQTSVNDLQKELIVISDWINEQNIFFSDECQMHNRKYRSDIKIPKDLKFSGNIKLLNRALNNLIDNACRYTKKEDSIVFSAKIQTGILLLTIDDSGSGIDREERDKIFELFYRGDKGRNSRGMGIGLSSVLSVIDYHGGKIKCEASSLGGASFIVSIPI